MKYTALYRKYRPIQFADVCGQEHIVSALSNQLKSDRIAHAYLFCGTRGTGKTTMAKIFAAAVNCMGTAEKPCGCCKNCSSFMEARSLNIIEMDAASNNGVDDIRNIVEEMTYPPVEGRYKVYIIDEVHMLSVNAFNALLKTLEEPPEYVIFILATTEPNKLPATILSRCQKYEFRQISSEVIFERLKRIADMEGLLIEDAALEYIARAGEGSMRDALSVMDRCVAFGIGQQITLKMISALLGTADYMVFGEMLRAIKEKKVIRLLQIIKDFSVRGLDYYRLTADFLWYLRNIMVLKVSASLHDILNVSEDAAKVMQEDAQAVEISDVIEYIEVLSGLYNKLKYSAVRRIDMEISLISMCKLELPTKDVEKEKAVITETRQKSGLKSDEKQERIQASSIPEYRENKIETAIQQNTNEIKNSEEESGGATEKAELKSVEERVQEKHLEEEQGENASKISLIEEVDVSGLLLKNTSGLMNSMLKNISIEVQNKDILFYAGNKLCENYFNDESKKTELNQILEKSGHIGYNIRCLCSKKMEKEPCVQDLEEKIKASIKNVPIELEE